MSQTKNKIAAATKELVTTTSFNQISVTKIMQTAGLRRQTFYDFFRDKYDVLAWIYEAEVGAAASKCETFNYWSQTVDQLLQYFDNNRDFYRKILTLDVQNAPETVIKAHFSTMIGSIFTDLSYQENLPLRSDYCQFLQRVLSEALYSAVSDWLNIDAPASFEAEQRLVQQYLEDGLNGLLLREKAADKPTPSVRYTVQ